MSEHAMPTRFDLMNPTIQALKKLGGSGTIKEIFDTVVTDLQLPNELLEITHNGSRTEVEYQLAWTRTYLKAYGLLENSARGVWALTPAGQETDWVDGRDLLRIHRNQKPQNSNFDEATESEIEETESVSSWREELISVLLAIEPDAFERLIQRLLRESGFIQVQVIGRSGDGGIDGTGIMRLGGLLSFHVLFQCKRWQGSVGASVVRDFRGAMVGRADKGLIVTTGSFSKDAIREATRDGAPAIDLIDGELLIDKLKELGLGVKTEMIEQVTVDANWYHGI